MGKKDLLLIGRDGGEREKLELEHLKRKGAHNRLRKAESEGKKKKKGEKIDDDNFEAIVSVVVDVEGGATVFDQEFAGHHFSAVIFLALAAAPIFLSQNCNVIIGED